MNTSTVTRLTAQALSPSENVLLPEVCKPAEAFFFAWKKGVELAGCRYFSDGSLDSYKNASCRWDLRPNLRVISTLFEVLTQQERVFLAAMVSFFDTDVGSDLLKQSGVKGLSDLGVLNVEQRDVLAALIMHNHAW